MRTFVIGCSHRTAPVEMREKIAFDEAAVPQALAGFRGRFPEAEAVLISTCNRVEVYVARPVGGSPGIAEVIAFLAEFHGLEAAQFAEGIYSYEDLEAVRHLFRVASSLDSMVLGESQILAQTRSAYEQARAAGTVGKRLEALFQRAFTVAKDVHTRTLITAGRLSVGSTAVDLARRIFPRFEDQSVLMVGAGMMGELTLNHLLEAGPRRLLVTNRTAGRAAELARHLAEEHKYAAEVVPFDQWLERLAEVDIVITCTGAPEPILTAGLFAPVLARRRGRALLLIDLAVPRDVDPAVGAHDGVSLYNIDDLQAVTEANLERRREAIEQCHRIIEAHVIEFAERFARGDLGPLIAALQSHFQQVGQQEWARLVPKLESASPRDRALIERMLHRVIQKLLHEPLAHLNERADNGAAQAYADTLRALFNLNK